MASTTTTEILSTTEYKGQTIVVTADTTVSEAWNRPGEYDTYTRTQARSDLGGRTALGRGWTLEKLVKQAEKAIDNQLAIDAIRPAANNAACDFGRDFDPSKSPAAFVPVPFDKVQVGDLVWVYSYQLWRRGVVESIGRTNLKVAIVVASTRTFSRQSVKAGEVFWDILNKR